ncbi:MULTISPECIES: type VI secretion system protein TssA [Burkholderia]|uniref:ImpA N-terminal domain-containing protein n=1 Tax=Burkholderia savannae TaxID=1637837 RepID=A0ABR5T252_9BURK|nr:MULTISPECIES: type VI secretion system ImpA family N-terminal domain-containing protein [Burkholderia]AOJ72715.1 ImpA [Burkholderia savannae]AOJ84750.1 ImpA [Burkholderia savannae]AOK49022.1 ImpA [Burkholderia sp. MSMB617WGS]KGS04271.1 hypothetical protein X946_584 [Burkholderia sp. ABCPW 111]KVG45053.1 ImpA [Burkholderia sp. MSMB0265]
MNATISAATLRYADLLAPVSQDAPCGPDLEYDPAFVMLQSAIAPKKDAQYGEFVEAPQPANWAEAERDCRALLLRTKDIRLVVILTRCRIRQSGAEGLRDGLALLNEMLARYGEALHPVPFFEGERDPVVYANAIATFADPDATLADIREIQLPKASGLQLQLRDIEKALAVTRVKDALAPESASRLLKEWWNRRDKTIVALAEAQRIVADLSASTRESLGEDAPDLSGIAKLLYPFAQAQLESPYSANAAQPQGDAKPANGDAAHSRAADTFGPAGDAGTQAPTASPIASPQPPMDRWGALAAIQATRLWFEQNEPSSPVIVLLRQSERMVGKRFSEIANAIPAELLARWDAVDV